MEKKLLFQKESIQLKNKMLFKIIKHMNNKILSLFFNQWDKRIIHIKNYHKYEQNRSRINGCYHHNINICNY